MEGGREGEGEGGKGGGRKEGRGGREREKEREREDLHYMNEFSINITIVFQVSEAGVRLRALLPQVPTVTDVYHPRDLTYERTASVSTLNWTQEFQAMSLPLFGRQYIQLVHTPMDVMHECLKLQLELKLPKEPSPLSVTQVREGGREDKASENEKRGRKSGRRGKGERKGGSKKREGRKE